MIQLSQSLSENPGNTALLEMVAVSYQNIGNLKEALAEYERLYAQTKSPQQLYQIATLQYGLERSGECKSSLQQLMLMDLEKEKISINMGQQSQEVPMRAAVMNFTGVLFQANKQLADAKRSFEEALKIAPNFVLAKNNLDNLNRPAAGTGTKPATGGK